MAFSDILRQFGRSVLRSATRPGTRPARPTKQSTGHTAPHPAPPHRSSPTPSADYAGDFTGVATATYAPNADDVADPGEIVWAWVPFEEDHTQGKDRPVLVVGHAGRSLLALMLTSKDHDRDAADEQRHGRVWVDIGAGGWDRQGRPSEVRVDRVLQLDPTSVRREGARLDRARFDEVAQALRESRGWR